MSAEQVTILRIAAGGDGVGRLADGRTVFVPRTAPTDVVELRDVRRHRRFARARVARLVERSADRVEPPCPHYDGDDCGGCQLQHLAAGAQRAARRAVAGDALRRIGRLDVEDPPLVPAPGEWHYRTKLTLHARGGAIGLHPLDDPVGVFDLQTCLITSAPLVEVWREVRRHRELLPAGLERVVLRLDRSGGLHLVAEVRPGSPWPGAGSLARALAARGMQVALWRRDGAAVEPIGADGPGRFPVTAFEQVHPTMGDLVRAWAVEQAGDVGGAHAWDLYAGTGATTHALVERGATVESVESDPLAVAFADASAPPAAGVTRHAARAEVAVGRLRAPDIVITNPPRTGMEPAVVEAIAASGARRLIYISCDPATLARDLQRLGDRYRLVALRAFDLFPQTAHVETVAVLERP